jgi:mannose-6-phosphate isomerase-like protein (cupin superfamily)
MMEASAAIEHIVHQGGTLAIIVRAGFADEGTRFFTPDDYSQQLAFMRHAKGRTIDPHTHNPLERSVRHVQEVLVIRRGRLRVDFYSDAQVYLESRTLEAGDVILLAAGGHGFEVLEDLEMFEVKQGPYAGDQDKTRFAATAPRGDIPEQPSD